MLSMRLVAFDTLCSMMEPPLREGCASYRVTPSSAVQFLAQMESSAGSFSIQSKNVTISALLFLNSGWSPGWCSQGMKSTGRTVWENFPSTWFLAWLPDLELCGLFAENSHLSCGMPVCQGLLFLARREGKKCSVYPPTLLPGWGIPHDPWPLRVAWSDPCLLWRETLEQGLWLAGDSSPPCQCFVLQAPNMSVVSSPPPSFSSFCFLFSSSSSSCEFPAWWMGGERENWRNCISRSNILFFLLLGLELGVFSAEKQVRRRSDPRLMGDEAPEALFVLVNYLAYGFVQMQLEMVLPSPVYLFSEDFIFNLISVFITETEDEMSRVSHLMFIY